MNKKQTLNYINEKNEIDKCRVTKCRSDEFIQENAALICANCGILHRLLLSQQDLVNMQIEANRRHGE